MGVNMNFLSYLDERGVLAPGASILDIGTQNLYLATPEGLRAFFQRHGTQPIERYGSLIQKLCEGGQQVGNGFRNDAFLSEVIAQTNMRYAAFDIFPAPATTVFDLNMDSLPEDHRNMHDLVLNFGTTEHVINQYNALRVIHEATKVGGWMFHQVPSSGCVDHGYFVYSPKLFTQIAAANGYEVRDLWFSGPSPQGSIFATIQYHLDLFRDASRPGNNLAEMDKNVVFDSCINVLMRKTRDQKFCLPLETSTSVGAVPEQIWRRYVPEGAPAPRRPGAPDPLLTRILMKLDAWTKANPQVNQTLKSLWAPLRALRKSLRGG